MVIYLVFVIIVMIIGIRSMKVLKQDEVGILERLGRFYKPLDPGLNLIVPFIDKVRVVLKTTMQTLDLDDKNVVTANQEKIRIIFSISYTLVDPVKSYYEIGDVRKSIKELSLASVRDIVSNMQPNEAFANRGEIVIKLRDILSEKFESLGCKIDDVIIKDIIIK